MVKEFLGASALGGGRLVERLGQESSAQRAEAQGVRALPRVRREPRQDTGEYNYSEGPKMEPSQGGDGRAGRGA